MDQRPDDRQLPKRELLNLLDCLDVIIFQIDLKGKLTYVNEAALRLTGYSRKQALSFSLKNIIAPESLKETVNNFEKRISGQEIPTYETVILDSKGKRHNLMVTATPLVSDGKVVGEIGVGQDITEEKATQHKIRYSLEFEKLLTSISTQFINLPLEKIDESIIKALESIARFAKVDRCFIFRLAEDEKRISFTHQWSLKDAKSKSDLRDLSSHMHPWLLSKIKKCEIINILDSSNLPKEAENTRKVLLEKDTVSLLVSPIVVWQKVKAGVGFAKEEKTFWSAELINLLKIISAIFSNVLERVESDNALRESEEQFKSLAEQSPNMIFINQDGKVVYANRKCEQTMGYSRQKFYAKDFDFRNLMGEDSKKKVDENFGKHLKGMDVEPDEYTLVTRSGRKIPAIITTKLIGYQGKSAILGIITDVSEMKSKEESILEGRRFLSNIFKSIQDGISILDKDLRIVQVNPTMEKWYSHNLPLIGKKCYEAYHCRSKRCEICPTVRTLQTNSLAWEIVPKTGARGKINGWLELYSFPLYDEETKEMKGVIEYVRDITERMKAEKALIDSEQQYRSTIDSMKDALHVADRRLNILFANEAFRKWNKKLGLSTKIVGNNIYDLYPFLPKKTKSEYRKVFREGNLLVTEETNTVNGKLITTETRKIPVFEGGKVERVITIVRDITDRKKAEKELKQSKEFSDNLIDTANAIILTLDRNGKIKTFNKYAEKLTGYRKNEVIGKKWFTTFIPENERKKLPEIFKEILVKKMKASTHENNIVTKDGQKRLISWKNTVIKDQHGKVSGVLSVGVDITEQRKAENDMISIKTHLETVLDGISDSIVVIDRKYKIISFNKAFEKWVGKSPKKIHGRKCYSVIHGYAKSCRKCVLRDVFKSAKPSESIHYHQRSQGRIYHETRAYPIVIDGRIEHTVYIFRDVTERERMKEDLKENYEKLMRANEELRSLDRMKTEFLSVASHELRTPLAIITGYADILQSGDLGALNQNQKNKLERISKNAKHLNQLVCNILDLTRMDSGELKLKKTSFKLDRLIKNVIDDMSHISHKTNIELEHKLGIQNRIYADKVRLRQLLVNLFENAIKFTQKGGKVEIKASEDKNRYKIVISDTGIGLRKKDLKAVFDKFYQVDASIQRDYKGVGLGLAICKKITDMHGGSIKVESRLGKGTKVTVTLPK